MYDDKPLNKDMTLLDISYNYAWRRVTIPTKGETAVVTRLKKDMWNN